MKVIILSQGFGGGCDHTIGCNKDWRVEDFRGTLEEACVFYKTRGLYGGDQNGVPEDYKRITDMEGQLKELMVLPYRNVMRIDMDKAREDHNAYWDEKEKDEADNKDRLEYERLSKKYGV